MKSCQICNQQLAPHRSIEGLLSCTQCDFITTNLSLSDEELKKLYTSDYFLGDEYADYIKERPVLEMNFRKKLQTILRLSGNAKNKTLFEIGCAYGFFLNMAKKYFSQVSGVDVDTDVTTYARQEFALDVNCGDFLQLPLEKKRAIDVFCMWDVIEHLSKPEAFIEKISRNITHGGLLAISTGDIHSLNARLRGKNWRQIHPPTHLHYFSRKSLTALLEKHGFEVIHCQYPGSWMDLHRILYVILVLRNKKEWVFNLLHKIGITKFKVYINLFDYMFMVARKKGSY